MRSEMRESSCRTDTISRPVFEPPPSSHLHSSFIPSPEDGLRIEETITGIHSTLDSVNEEILRLRSALADLEGYRTDLYTNLHQYQAVLSPLRRLPPEILGEIFSFASEGHCLRWPFETDGHHSMPWVLGKVCSYWRTVVLSLPTLWSEVHLDLELVEEPIPINDNSDSDVESEGELDPIVQDQHNLKLVRRSNQVQELLQACLARSGNELLVFSVKANSLNSKATIKSILASLVQHAERWLDADFSIGDLAFYHQDLAPAKNRVSNLHRLHIGFYSMEIVFLIRTPLDAFENAPKLRELMMTHVVHPFDTLRLPWPQITSLVSKWSTFREGAFTQIMRRAINLVSFTTEGERILEVASSEPVLLPHLENLTIISKGSYIPKTFQFLTMPNLKKLAIHALTPFLADQTIPMIARSQCKPTQLTFSSSLDADAVWEENIGIVRFLGELQALTSLHLIVVRSADEIMPRLYYRRQQGPPLVLPYLQTIKLEDRLCLSATKVVEAMSSRIEDYENTRWGAWPKGQVGLKSIMLSLSRPPAPKYPELDPLKEMASKVGVEIKILTE